MDVLLFTTKLSIIACRHMVPYYYSGVPVKVIEIADIYGFKARSLNPSFTALAKAGILSSRVGGRYEDRGFLFAKDPKKVTLYDIVKALEGKEKVKCCNDQLKCRPSSCKECGIYKEFQEIINYRKKVLSSITIYEKYEEIKNI